MLQRTGPWTFDETVDLPDDLGLRYEVVDGALVIGQPVTAPHQRASNRLIFQLHHQLPPGWEALVETGMRMGTDGRRPDGCLVRRDAPAGRRQMGFDASDVAMVLEVVSPSSRKNDRFLKPLEYAEAGVPAYWRLEPDPEPRLHVFALQDGAYAEVDVVTGLATVSAPFVLQVDLRDLFP